jgi:hypothetical protein
MILFTLLALRLFGLSGILGAILFMCGDLLYGHVPGSKDSPAQKMSKLAEARLLKAGMLGLIGCWFYSLASLHVYMAFQPAGQVFAFVLALAFAVTMINYGIGHAAYFSIATGAQTALKLGADPEQGGKFGNAFFNRLTTIIYIPVVVFSVMMVYAILTGGSHYPLWMLVFQPAVLYLLKTPVLKLLKGNLQEMVTDTYDNLILFVFFSLSTLVLWNGF